MRLGQSDSRTATSNRFGCLLAGAFVALLLLGPTCIPLQTIEIRRPHDGQLIDDATVRARVDVGFNFLPASVEVRLDGVDLVSGLGLSPPFSGRGGSLTVGSDLVTVSDFHFSAQPFAPYTIRLEISGLSLGSRMLEVDGETQDGIQVGRSVAFVLVEPFDQALHVIASGGTSGGSVSLPSGGRILAATFGQPFAAPPVDLNASSFDLLVVSTASSQVLRYDGQTGAYRGQFGGAGPADSLLSLPFGIATGPDGDLYVDSDTNRVLRYDGRFGGFAGEFVGPSGGLVNARDLEFGSDGNLYVANFSPVSRVLRYDGQTGLLIDGFLDPTACIKGFIEFGPDGNLYTACTSGPLAVSIHRFDGTTGQLIDVFVPPGSGLSGGADFTFGPDGNLYAIAGSQDPRVLCFDGGTGLLIDEFIPVDLAVLRTPKAIAFDPPGARLFITGNPEENVVHYDATTGAPLGVFGDASAADSDLDGPSLLEFVPAGGGQLRAGFIAAAGSRIGGTTP